MEVNKDRGARAAEFQIESVEALREGSNKKQEGFATQTMANVYLSQGFLEKAIDIYKVLLAENPEDQKLKTLIQELEAKANRCGERT